MSRILITGGAGFIGSNLAERLIGEGYEVVILDREPNPRNLCLFRDELEYHPMDVCSPRKVRALISGNGVRAEGIHGVVHLAAVSRVIWGQERPQETIRTNIGGTANLLRALRAHRVTGERPWVIFGSSREVYGEPMVFPVTENHPVSPVNLYGRTKLRGEELIRNFSRDTGSRAVILRFSNVYGNERDILDRVIPRFVLSALKDQPLEIHGGNQLIDFTHITDTVEGIVRAIRRVGNGDMLRREEAGPGEPMGDAGRAGGDDCGVCPNPGKAYLQGDSACVGVPSGPCEAIHLLPGRPITLQQVVAAIAGHLGTDIPVRYGEARNYDVERFHGEPTKAERLLGFKARVMPERGIPMTVERFRMVMEK